VSVAIFEERTMVPAYHFSAASYPATYRQREVETIVSAIRARKSLLVSGLAGMGKSHLMRFLVSNEAFRQRYFPEDATGFAFFFIDCNAMDSEDERSFYRVVITELCQQAGLETSERLQGVTSEELLTALKGCLDSLYRERLTLVFILDRFEKLYRSEKLGHILDNLRYLRDHFARRISYILAARGEIDIASLSEEFEDLLYHPAALCLKPLTPTDAEGSIERYEREYNVVFDHQVKRKLISYSGGYPRLLRAVCELAQEGRVDLAADDAEAIRQLLNDRRIQSVCQKIWEGLSGEDQAALRLMLTGASAPEDSSFLIRYGLVITAQGGQPEIFCPLFETFVRESRELGLTLQLVPPNKVLRGGQAITLTSLEFRFLTCLLEKPDEVCPYDEIIEKAYPDVKMREGVTPQALAGLAKRTRKKVNVPGHNFIENVRGVGYRLNVEPGTAKRRR
jgi:hypothetical protein